MLLQDLTTPRLRFRPLALSDQEVLTTFFENEAATRLLKIQGSPAQHALARIERQQQRYALDGDGLMAIVDRHSGIFIGICGLIWQEVDGQRELEIGYHLQPEHWKKGYATEAARACRDFAFAQKLAPSLISIIDIRNVNSQRVALRNGLQRERETVFHDKAVYIYRIKASDISGND